MTRKHIWEMLEKLEKGQCFKSDVMDAVDAYSEALLQQTHVMQGEADTLPPSAEQKTWAEIGLQAYKKGWCPNKP